MKGQQTLHHIHKRKRMHNKEEKLKEYPNKNIRALDKAMLFIAILAPIMTIPQIAQIYFLKNASGVSTITWFTYLLLNIPWLLYGFIHKDKPIIISTALWVVVNTIVTIGSILY